MLVRLALENDEDAYVELARLAVEESARDVGFNPGKVRETFRRYLTEAHPTIFVVEAVCRSFAGAPYRAVIGFLNATISEYTFADGIYTTQEVMFVRPDKRGTRAAALLVKELVRWSLDIVGAKEITGGNDNALFTEQTARLLEKNGFERVGLFMRRRGVGHG